MVSIGIFRILCFALLLIIGQCWNSIFESKQTNISRKLFTEEQEREIMQGRRSGRRGKRSRDMTQRVRRGKRRGQIGLQTLKKEIKSSQELDEVVEKIILESDRYHMWWTGPVNDPSFSFQPSPWGANHNPANNAIFTMAVIQGKNDFAPCSSPNDLILYFGTARKYFQGDIVVALEADVLSEEVKHILQYYHIIVYLLPTDLCSKETKYIFCGSNDERVPASVFRYYFYEKWSLKYSKTSLLLLSDFRDIFFQSNPFEYRIEDWLPNYQLATFLEYSPNMQIYKCKFNRQVIEECFGEQLLQTIGEKTIVSSGAMLGTRDGIMIWSNAMTKLLQDAPGRMVETRCMTGGIDHGFINYLIYGNNYVQKTIHIKLFAHGEGPVNSLGGLRPDTVEGNITGSIKSFWKLLSEDGYILNWNNEISPIVHQLDHFQIELLDLADELFLQLKANQTISKSKNQTMIGPLSGTQVLLDGLITNHYDEMKCFTENRPQDRVWQILASSQCLFDCQNSSRYQ